MRAVRARASVQYICSQGGLPQLDVSFHGMMAIDY
jgi:hypothetical protein